MDEAEALGVDDTISTIEEDQIVPDIVFPVFLSTDILQDQLGV